MKAITTWEYRYVYFKTDTDDREIEQMLNEMGYDGWELVSIVFAGDAVRAKMHSYVFKRPR